MERRSNKNRSLKLSRGYSLIETAAVLPFLLALIVGTFDLNNVIQAYTAMQEGVDRSLRCAYPTDSRCARTAIAPIIDYDLTRVITDARWPVDRYRYSGEAQWLAMQSYNVTGRARVLDQANYGGGTPQPGFANIGFAKQVASKPFAKHDVISLGDLGLRHPDFVYRNNQNVNYPGVSYSLNSVDLKSINDNGRIDGIQIPALPNGFTACYQSQKIDFPGQGPSAPANFNRSCGATEIVLEIKGNPQRQSASKGMQGQGVVGIRLIPDGPGAFSINGNPNQRTLGGQLFNKDDGNFYARGIGEESANGTPVDTNTEEDREEFDLYQSIKGTPGSTFSLKFTLDKPIDQPQLNIGWKGDSVKVYFSQYTTEVYTGVPCSNPATTGPQDCHPILPDGREAPLDTITALTGPGGSPFVSAATPSGGSVTCPLDNLGVYGDPNVPDSAAHRTARAICGVPSGVPDVSFTKREKGLGIRPYVPADCSAPSTPTDDEYHRIFPGYPELLPPVLTPGDLVPIFTGSVSPAEYKAAHPEHSCLSEQSRSFTCPDGGEDSDTHQSLFCGKHDLNCGWEAALRSDAVDLGMNPGAYFVGTRSVTDTVYRGSRPSQACYEGTPQLTQIGEEPIPGGPFTEAEFPHECRDGTWVCRSAFHGVRGGRPARDGLDLSAALIEGVTAIETNLSWAKSNCQGDQCGQVEYTSSGEDEVAASPACSTERCIQMRVEHAGQQVVATASVEVPLRALRVFGNRTITLTYADHERREAELIQ